MNSQPPTWNGQIDTLYARQNDLAAQVMLRDMFAKPLRTVAGFRVDAASDDGADAASIHAKVVLLDADTMEVLEQRETRATSRMPNNPDLLGFRFLPAMLEALESLSQRPNLAFVAGHGIDHPRRFGVASHFALAANLPSVGISQSVLIGTSKLALHEMRGAFTPLRDGKMQVGWLLRSKVGEAPLVVASGHRVSLASAPGLVMRYVTQYRLPEPLRFATPT